MIAPPPLHLGLLDCGYHDLIPFGQTVYGIDIHDCPTCLGYYTVTPNDDSELGGDITIHDVAEAPEVVRAVIGDTS